MKSVNRTLLATLLAVAISLGFYALAERSRQTAQRQALEAKIAAARTAIDFAQRECGTAERALAALTRASEEAKAAAAASRVAAPPLDPAVSGWERKVTALRSLLAQHPDWAIPEIDLLSPDEFIFFARDAQLDGEEAQRKTLNDLRSLAKRKLASQFHQALDDYANANGGRLPAGIHDLTSYLKSPLPDAVLNRYALTGLAVVPVGAGRDDWLLYERAPVDELYDTRQLLGARMSVQIETNPAIYVLTRALAAYADANAGGKPAQPVELISYLEAPLDAPTLARYFSDWQKDPVTLNLHEIRTASYIITMFPPLGAPRENGK